MCGSCAPVVARGAHQFISMTPDVVRKINLLDCLQEEHPDIRPPPEDAALAWTERQLRDYFALTSRAAASALAEQRPDPGEATATGDDAAQTAAEAIAPQSARCAGAVSADDTTTSASCQPGGGVEQVIDPHLDPGNAPSVLRMNQLAATVDGYRRAAVADGIPFRCRAFDNLPLHTVHVLKNTQHCGKRVQEVPRYGVDASP